MEGIKMAKKISPEIEQEIIKLYNSGLSMAKAGASQKDIEKIGNYIYQNKDNCFLSRKYNNFLQIIHGNTEVNS